jgi:predicted dienelactone hydrolase
VNVVVRAWLASLLTVVVACASSGGGDVPSGRYDGSRGRFEVREGGDVVLRDFRRGKDLRVTVSFPGQGGPFPVIVFSHGAGGNGNYPYPLTRFWTSHGYVCIHPTHADSVSLGGGASESGPTAWENRARDLSFVIDSLDELVAKVPALAGKMDARRIGVAGYSYGGHSAQLLGGATLEAAGGGEPRSLADPRPIALSLCVSKVASGDLTP